MSITLRVILIISSFISFFLSVKKIKQSKLKVANSVTWMFGSIVLILMSIFSGGVEWVSTKLGFEAPVNFVFVIIIAFLLIEAYLSNLRMTELNEKIKNLAHHIALKDYEEKEVKGNKDGE